MSQKIIEVSKKGKAAISVSIRKWERVVKAWERCAEDETPDVDGIGVEGCGLCTLYRMCRMDGWYVACEFCPIRLDTGEIVCIHTPFDKYESYQSMYFNKEGAQAELDYLRDLDSRCVVVPGLRANRVKA